MVKNNNNNNKLFVTHIAQINMRLSNLSFQYSRVIQKVINVLAARGNDYYSLTGCYIC